MVHVKDDMEVGLEERRANQKIINGAVSMLLKIFQVGKDCKHEARWRESMLSKGLEACPLWLLFKDHKLWESSRGTAPPTRPVMGGNSGMNTHLSEILSWLLEPLATAMIGKSSEVISGEDLKNKMDSLNTRNRNWQPDPPLAEPIGESEVMMEALDAAPGLCGCRDCVEESSNYEASTGREECVNTQTGSVGVAGPQSNTVVNGLEESRVANVEYVTSSVRRRGNRNKALLIREQRERLKQRRTNAYKRCDKVNSRDVPKEWIQDRSRTMVIIGTDAVSLYPSLEKQESADEVAVAVQESNLKWEGVSWKEATRFLVLGRDETWCRKSSLWRVLPKRRFKHGVRPGLTGVGPMGAEPDDEVQWEFRPEVRLTEEQKTTVMAEVMRLAVELMYDTHLYTFGGKCYKQREGGPIGLRSTCALARVVMGRWDIKWKKQLSHSKVELEDDGRYVDDARAYLYPIRPGWRWEEGELWYRKEWEAEDELLSPTERTKRVIQESMVGVTRCLKFTT